MKTNELKKLVESYEAGDEALEIMAPALAREVIALREAADEALVALQEARSEMRDYADNHPSMKIIFDAEDALRAVLGENE
jgi:methyl coenzyme M reductase gamma subunit